MCIHQYVEKMSTENIGFPSICPIELEGDLNDLQNMYPQLKIKHENKHDSHLHTLCIGDSLFLIYFYF